MTLLTLDETLEGSTSSRLNCSSIAGNLIAQITIDDINKANWLEARRMLGPGLKDYLHKGRLQFVVPNGFIPSVEQDTVSVRNLFM